MASIFSGFSGMASGFSLNSFITMFFWTSLVVGVLTVAGMIIYRKVKYVYQGEIFKRRQDDFETNLPQASIVSGIAGYFNRRGKTVFRVKFGKMPWQKIELTKLPDPKYMIGNKIYYIQLNKDNYVQARVKIDWEGVMSLEPVEDDLKYGAQLDLYEKDRILDTSKLTPLTVGLIVMGLVIVSGIIVFYFLSKAG